MKLIAKTIFFVSVLFLSAPATADMSDYVSAFKPAQKQKSIRELTNHIKKDISKIRSLLKSNKKKITGLMPAADGISGTNPQRPKMDIKVKL